MRDGYLPDPEAGRMTDAQVLRAFLRRGDLWPMATTWIAFALLVAAGGLWTWAGWAWALGGVAYGIGLYSLIEYVVHRWVMHAIEASPLLVRLTGPTIASHRGHHADPGEFRGSLNVEQTPMLLGAVALLGLGLLMPVPASFMFFAVAAGSLAHLAQEIVHFACHQLPMRGRWMAAIKRRHMLHHHRDDTTHYGILFGVWDRWLGTEFRR